MKTETRNRKIVEMYLTGRYTHRQVGNRFGLSEAGVRYIMRDVEYRRDRTQRPKDFGKIKRAYVAGYAPSHLAKRFGSSSETIVRELLRDGLPIRPTADYHRRFTDAEEIAMGTQYLEGATLAEIAARWGHGDKSLVAKCLECQGIPRRTMKETRDLRGTWPIGPRKSVVEWP